MQTDEPRRQGMAVEVIPVVFQETFEISKIQRTENKKCSHGEGGFCQRFVKVRGRKRKNEGRNEKRIIILMGLLEAGWAS